MTVETKLDTLAADIAYLLNRGAAHGISGENYLWIVAERILFAYPLKVQRALLVLLVTVPEGGKGNVLLSSEARQKLVGYLTDEVNVWGDE